MQDFTTFVEILKLDDPLNINLDTRYQIKLISLISLGMFLFMLFFQPFEYKMEDFNDRMIFVLGIAAITFIVLGIFRIVMPVSITRRIHAESIKISNEVGLILLIWLFITAANVCYLYFVGKIDLTLSVGVQIALFSAFPSIVLKLADVNRMLRDQLQHFVRRNLKLEQDLSKEKEKPALPVLLKSDSKNDDLEALPDDLMMFQSADNYVIAVYRKDDRTERKMLRTTMKSIQGTLKEHPEFLRCHRTCIVNTSYILNLSNSYKGHRLTLLDMEEEIPVSRQYLLSIKEVLNSA